MLRTQRQNKNCLGSFQVLWNKNCTTENEEIIMKKLIKNLNPKKLTKKGIINRSKIRARKRAQVILYNIYLISYVIQVIIYKLYY